MTLDSLKEWLTSWGDGPHWADATGATVPITKDALLTAIASAERMRKALQDLRDRALMRVPSAASEFSPATAASIAIICENALEESDGRQPDRHGMNYATNKDIRAFAKVIIQWIFDHHEHDHNKPRPIDRDVDTDHERPCVDSLNLEAYIKEISGLTT